MTGMQNIFACPNCHSVLVVGALPDGASVKSLNDDVSGRRRRASKKPPAEPPRKELNTVAVAHWLVLGGPVGLSGEPLWGELFPAQDVFSRYQHWAVRFGLRRISARSLFQALAVFGVTAERDGQKRYHRFPAAAPAALLDLWRARPCPGVDGQSVVSVPGERLPWVESWREALAVDPEGPWADYLARSEAAGWVDVENPSPPWLIPYPPSPVVATGADGGGVEAVDAAPAGPAAVVGDAGDDAGIAGDEVLAVAAAMEREPWPGERPGEPEGEGGGPSVIPEGSSVFGLKWLTYRDLATATGLPLARIRMWGGRGQLPAPDFRVGQSPAWYPGTVAEWIAGHTVDAAGELR